jgi:phosphoglycerol transferase
VAYAGTALLSLAALAALLRLWRASPGVLLYPSVGDAVFTASLVKATVETGWYLDNPFVGVPGGQHLQAFPLPEAWHFLLLKLIGLVVPHYAVVMNVYFVATFPVTALTALYALRSLSVSYPPAILGSLLFAFAPYHFWRGEYHLVLAAYYLVPLVVMLALQLAGGERPAGVRSWPVALGVAMVTGIGGVYYAFFAAFFFLVGGTLGWLRTGAARRLLAGLALVAAPSPPAASPTWRRR